MLDRIKALKPQIARMWVSGPRSGPPVGLLDGKRAPRAERRGGLVEREKLWRPKAWGRMWRETKPRGPEGIKPLRG
jgi:hypothetical protein